ncbi:endonuclease/exonuclease/phosphatase family protein [Gelidibacter sp. F2691]|nr:endonuclease/exonuclease/phosphatase family protein [Gelidibacter sp. F2691]
MKKRKLIFKACALIAYAFLLMMHLILKDHIQFSQVFFYAVPLPFLIFFGIIVTLLFYRWKPIFIALIGITLSMTAYWFYTAYNFTRATEIPDKATVVMFWNAADAWKFPVEVLMEHIKSARPDIIGLVETEYASEEDLNLLSSTFPSYEFKILEGFMMVGVKGNITKVNFQSQEASYKINFVEANLNGNTRTFLITDIYQSPTMNKEKALGAALQFALQNNAEIIMGDFNTPQQSVHFQNFTPHYTSLRAFGKGFTATWPFGFPLLELDQIFANKIFKPILLQKFYQPESDHALLVGYVKE